jgi:hypothetical protein
MNSMERDMPTRKQTLINDIQNLLNTHKQVTTTSINPALLEFLDEDTLVEIISNLLEQKENSMDADVEWLEKFKKTV